MFLTQVEAVRLLTMRKRFVDRSPLGLTPGGRQSRDLISDDKRERFLFDSYRGKLRVSKYTYQTRARRLVILARLDIDGSPHTNPDGSQIGRTHLHIYREGFEDKWATNVDPVRFGNLADIYQTFVDFCGFCNIHHLPPFQGGLV